MITLLSGTSGGGVEEHVGLDTCEEGHFFLPGCEIPLSASVRWFTLKEPRSSSSIIVTIDEDAGVSDVEEDDGTAYIYLPRCL